MSGITVVREAESVRLVKGGDGRYAVVEVRNGRVYSLAPKPRTRPRAFSAWRAPMAGGRNPPALRRLRSAVRGGQPLSEIIW